MQEILDAIKQASIEIKHLIETGDTGKSDNQNSTGDTQLKLDIASDVIIENIFKTSADYLRRKSSVKVVIEFQPIKTIII